MREWVPPTRVESGEQALSSAASAANVQMVMAAIVGAAGLTSTLAAVRAGKRVLLANKEALVMTGRLLMDEVRRAGAELIPIDSEHNAIFQCMPGGYLPGDAARGVTRVILTASGGPFRSTAAAKMAHVTPDEACAHPKWKMGRKISVDSATLMNKGLEVIEATLLFGLPEISGRCRRAPAKRGALAGRIRGWLHAGATRCSRHAHAHCAGAGVARAICFRCTILGSARDWTSRIRAAGSCSIPEFDAGTSRCSCRRHRPDRAKCGQ